MIAPLQTDNKLKVHLLPIKILRLTYQFLFSLGKQI